MQDRNERESLSERKAKSPFGTVTALGILGLVIAYFYIFPPDPRTFVKAVITIHEWRDQPSLPSGTTIVIDDEASLGELSSFLPGAGRKRYSMIAGGWITGVVVELHAPNGEIVEVHISSDLVEFSDLYSSGDGRMRRGFDRFLLSNLGNQSSR